MREPPPDAVGPARKRFAALFADYLSNNPVRLRRGYSNNAFAQAIGKSPPTIGYWRRGTALPDNEKTLEEILRALFRDLPGYEADRTRLRNAWHLARQEPYPYGTRSLEEENEDLKALPNRQTGDLNNIASSSKEAAGNASPQESQFNDQISCPARCFGRESEIEKAPSPSIHDGHASSSDKAQPSIPSARGARRVSLTIAGAVIGLIIQTAAVVANKWLTGKPIESALGLFGAHVVPFMSAVIGAIAGFALASRSQRSKKPVLLEK